jgi:2-phospho-L-lactate guanylyltransferase (CobY/MobA/RfbA family)
MATVVVPFRSGGKSRLPEEIRVEVALAMLGDVLEAAVGAGDRVRLVTGDGAATALAVSFDVEVVADPGGGQGAAVEAALDGVDGVCLVVNADLPCASADALASLAAEAPAHVAAADGTTNALALPAAGWFRPVFGPGSAARFAAAGLRPVRLTALEHDVDMISDLEALPLPAGRRTAFVLNQHKLIPVRTA